MIKEIKKFFKTMWIDIVVWGAALAFALTVAHFARQIQHKQWVDTIKETVKTECLK